MHAHLVLSHGPLARDVSLMDPLTTSATLKVFSRSVDRLLGAPITTSSTYLHASTDRARSWTFMIGR